MCLVWLLYKHNSTSADTSNVSDMLSPVSIVTGKARFRAAVLLFPRLIVFVVCRNGGPYRLVSARVCRASRTIRLTFFLRLFQTCRRAPFTWIETFGCVDT